MTVVRARGGEGNVGKPSASVCVCVLQRSSYTLVYFVFLLFFTAGEATQGQHIKLESKTTTKKQQKSSSLFY